MPAFVLPALTGLLLALAFPRAGQGWLGWLAWVPLLIFIARARRRRAAFGGGWLAGVLWFFPLLRWMPEVMGRYGGMAPPLAWAAYALLIVVLACYPALACVWLRYLLNRLGPRAIFLFPFIWVALEFLQSVSPLGGLPWLLAGYTQTGWLGVIQIADLAGVYGVSFLVIAVNTALAAALLHLFPAAGVAPQSEWRARLRWSRPLYLPLAGAALLLATALGYGQLALRRWEKIATPWRAALLQGNLSVEDAPDVLDEKFAAGYVRMADSLQVTTPAVAAAAPVDLLVLPESPAPMLFQSDKKYQQTMRGLARRYPLGLVLSNIRVTRAAPGTQNDDEHYNSAFFLDNRGELTGVYDKMHLVPFGEYIPYKKLLFFAETVSKEMGGFSAGREVKVLSLGGHPASAVICFEAVFPDLVRRFVAAGSQVIVNLTNDGWYGVSAAPYQHLQIARLRAIENRRWLLRAANTGFSAFIAPTGRLEAVTSLETEAICRGRFAFIADKTFYTRTGNLFLWLCVIISVGAGLPRRRLKSQERARPRSGPRRINRRK